MNLLISLAFCLYCATAIALVHDLALHLWRNLCQTCEQVKQRHYQQALEEEFQIWLEAEYQAILRELKRHGISVPNRRKETVAMALAEYTLNLS